MKFLINGATGFIATNLVQKLLKDKHHITLLTTTHNYQPPNCKVIFDVNNISNDENFDVIINLAGHAINKYWTKKVKSILINSRLNSTKQLTDLISRLKIKPKVFISASAIGFYGSQSNQQLNENSSFQESFTHKLCHKWEQEANKVNKTTRVCIIRLGVVLGNGGMLAKMISTFKYGMGLRVGDKYQPFSWIHIKDVIHGIEHLINNNNSKGVYNFTNELDTYNLDFVQALSSCLNPKFILTIPKIAVKIMFGQMGKEILLVGNHIKPNRLLSEGYKFKFKDVKLALDNIIQKNYLNK